MGETLGARPTDIRAGAPVKARDIQALADAAKIAVSPSFSGAGTSAIIDRDGVHVRARPQKSAPTEDLGAFMAVVINSQPSAGYVIAKRAVGTLGHLQPQSATAPSFYVWVGYETFLRGPAGLVYDEILCIPLNAAVNNISFPYFGIANIPGFAHIEPTTGYAANQDTPGIVAGD